MDKAINKTLDNYIKLVKTKFTDIERVFVFGSFVKGNQNQDSDIDLALVFKDLDDSKRFDVQVKLMLLALDIDSRIEPHPFSQKDFNSGNPFAIEIQRTGIELNEQDI